MKTFKHSGELGDIVYSLPTIKALGGGILYLNALWKMAFFNEERAMLLKPLLMAQPYIEDVKIYNNEEKVLDYDLDKFRGIGFDIGYMNLAEAHLRAFDLPINLINEQWLFNVGKRRVFDRSIVFHRSLHHHDDKFPWKDLIKQYRGQAVCIGLKEECMEGIPFYQVYNFLEMAEIINGTDLFIGNQSFPFAISEGLHKRNYLEICKACPNCNFKREGHNE